MLIFVVSSVQQLGISIDNWCHVNVKTSWFKKSLSSSHPLIARPRSIQSITVCACHMKHSNTVIAHSNTERALFWWSRLTFCLCYQFIAKVTSLWSVHTRHNKKLCLASQNKKRCTWILALHPSTSEAKRWRTGVLPGFCSSHLDLVLVFNFCQEILRICNVIYFILCHFRDIISIQSTE